MKYNLFSNLSNKRILDASFGLEREGLRVTNTGAFSLTPHPERIWRQKRKPLYHDGFFRMPVRIDYACLSYCK